jgi:transcriptional regulator with XRE-family HTH domain|tara:strand:+ start:277 stop:675 length:399 start_codon:yes stop_codon:yes gene_type:complete
MSTWIDRAKKEMKRKNLTQQDIAPSMGKSTRGAIGHYFTGRSKPTLEQLENLAKFLGVSLSWLVADSKDIAVVDDDTLELCLQLVEEAQDLAKEDLTPAQMAKMTAYLYRVSKDGKEVNQTSAIELLKLVTS